MSFEQRKYEVNNPSGIHSIVLVDADVPVEVLPSGDDSMYCVYFESDKEKYDIEVNSGTLYIKKRMRIMIGLFQIRSTPDYVKLSVYVPESYQGELSATSADGDIRIHGISMSNLAVKTMDGDIAVNRSHINGPAACKTTDGDISVGNITALEVSLKTMDGDIVLDRPFISNKISSRTTDGHIKGLLAGRRSDYTFAVRTVDGRSNITSGGNGRTLCELKAFDGNIDISFEDGV